MEIRIEEVYPEKYTGVEAYINGAGRYVLKFVMISFASIILAIASLVIFPKMTTAALIATAIWIYRKVRNSRNMRRRSFMDQDQWY